MFLLPCCAEWLHGALACAQPRGRARRRERAEAGTAGLERGLCPGLGGRHSVLADGAGSSFTTGPLPAGRCCDTSFLGAGTDPELPPRAPRPHLRGGPAHSPLRLRRPRAGHGGDDDGGRAPGRRGPGPGRAARPPRLRAPLALPAGAQSAQLLQRHGRGACRGPEGQRGACRGPEGQRGARGAEPAPRRASPAHTRMPRRWLGREPLPAVAAQGERGCCLLAAEEAL